MTLRDTVLGLAFGSAIIFGGGVFGPAEPAQATTPHRCPQYEPALRDRNLPVDFFSKKMWDESRCDPLAFNDNRKTQDLSLGLLMHNLYSQDARDHYVAAGYTYQVLLTVDGNLNATVWRYNRCGTGPWVRTKRGYGCAPPARKAVYR